MPGLFIKRQAEALAKRHSVMVISVCPDPACSNNFEVVHTEENSVRVCRVYYKTSRGIPIVSKLINVFRYVRSHHLGYMSFMPLVVDIVHGHIFTREILFTWYMAGKQRKPYVVSEHWSRYFPENGTYKGMFRKWLTRVLLKKSGGLIAVSDSLAEAMKASGLEHPKTFVVPNVVDTSLYIPPAAKPQAAKAVILHVSCFEDKSKNITAFLDAMAELYSRRKDFNVLLVGDGPDRLAMTGHAHKLGLRHPQTEFTGLKEDAELIRIYQSSSFLVQTSRYETFGTVVIEALACGLPVVSTRTGIAPSVINKNNGILIQQSDVDQIVEAVEQMLDYYPTFEIGKLHESVSEAFSDERISESLSSVYYEIICACQKD